MADLITPGTNHSASPRPDREWARRQVEKKRKLYADLIAYLVVNAFLIVIWAFTGFGYFWPGWVIAGWGVLWLLSARNVYRSRPITDDDIDRELRGRR